MENSTLLPLSGMGRERGRAQVPPPWLWKAAHGLSQALAGCSLCLVCLLRVLLSPHGCGEGSRVQVGHREDRSHSRVLPVVEIRDTRVNVQEMHREKATAGGRQCV